MRVLALSRDLVESTPLSGIHKPAEETACE